ncbi:carbohydrate ABC transporter permease [Aureibacillus halotolerans]|uniref:Carbohydrate ABC transporter membrane protein 2 (CUT1 family) n=1 Tax=Aureibacillus halotolerans TaxID=1508390 RepID=A0A4R6TSJ3_9BACI|nr:carbohydrate ABC transporter permease [Aureibacillus halotolerans]TDQ36271.1 carbohydrate ABC transporter membrane protein 2 (CUT1 family) [Aureibacillus halotolerans]
MAKKSAINRSSFTEKLFDLIINILMVIVIIATLYPFLNVLAISFNDSTDTVRGGIHIWPREFTLKNYETIFGYGNLTTAFINSVLRTVIGTVIGLIACTMLAYAISRKDFQARRFMSVFLVLTLFFSGGLIPGYMLIRDLGMINSFWVYVLPGMVNAFYVFMIRSFIDNLPISLQESAKIDGANDFTIYLKVIIPLCTPILATMALFISVGQWNSWFDTYIYNGSNEALTTLQYELMKILQTTQVTAGADAQRMNEANRQMVSPESVKMAISMVTIFPILCVYPFMQKYFVKGMTIGSIKS